MIWGGGEDITKESIKIDGEGDQNAPLPHPPPPPPPHTHTHSNNQTFKMAPVLWKLLN